MGLKTALYDTHVQSGAKIVDFGGWDMPLHYGSQIEEHHAVRRDAGMFDASSTLATKSNAMFLHGWKEKGIISENYSAITGEGDDPRLSSDRFHSWGALMGFMSLIESGKMPAPEASMAGSR